MWNDNSTMAAVGSIQETECFASKTSILRHYSCSLVGENPRQAGAFLLPPIAIPHWLIIVHLHDGLEGEAVCPSRHLFNRSGDAYDNVTWTSPSHLLRGLESRS